MTSPLLCLLTATILTSPFTENPAVELRYTGTLSQVGRDGPGDPVKEFSIYVLVRGNESGGSSVAYLVDERGGSGWAWPERFGTIDLDKKHRPIKNAAIRLLHQHNQSLVPVSIRQPLFEYSDRLGEGEAEWNVGAEKYRLTGEKKIGERLCRRVEVSNNFGRTQTLWIEQNSPLLVAAEQRIVMGRGDRFLLSMKLESTRGLQQSELDKIDKPFKTMILLQRDLNRKQGETNPDLSDAQLETALAVIDRLEDETLATPFTRLAEAISRDVKSQLKRIDSVAGLAEKFVGQKTPQLELTALNGREINSDTHAGKIVLLHFWKYRGDPPEEPYGQVGYLDFLNSRRKKLGLRIYGVAVDSRLGEAKRRSPALRQIRKLKEFMNLSYPIAIDDGSLLKEFGDPRRVHAKLPLWVLIAPDGAIAHYHVGYYDIKPDEGLRTLDGLIVELIKKQRKEADGK